MNKQRRLQRNQHGFTLIEAALFLAVSSLLVIIALVGFGSSFRNVRFSTGVRDIQSNITSQLSAASLGEGAKDRPACSWESTNNRIIFTGTSSDKGANQDCVIIGRVVGVYRDRLGYFDIAARRTPLPTETNCTGLEGIIRCYRPVTYYTSGAVRLAQPNGEYEYKNGITIPVRSVPGETDLFNALVFGIMQDPNGTERYRFFYNGQYADFTYRPAGVTTGGAGTTDPKIARGGMTCFQLSNRKAALQFDINKDEPEIIFEDPRC